MIEELKNKEKKYTRRIWLTWICGIALTILFAFLCFKFEKEIFAWLFVASFFAFSVIATVFEVKRITIDAKFMWYNYKTNQSLSSGVMLIITIFVLPALYLAVMLKYVPDDWKNAVQSVLSCLIAAFPAFLSLLGIHYSNTIQQLSKKKEIQNINKPYPLINMDNSIRFNEDGKCILVMNLDIQNIANNILIPLSITYKEQICELSYSPINNKMHSLHPLKRIVLGSNVTKTSFNMTFIYKDSLENKYKSDFVVDINEHGKVIANLSEGIQIYD